VTRWSLHKHLTVILAIVCTALIICAHLCNPGSTQYIAMTNRGFGILMVCISTFPPKSREVLKLGFYMTLNEVNPAWRLPSLRHVVGYVGYHHSIFEQQRAFQQQGSLTM
jgi:hypothetical protein